MGGVAARRIFLAYRTSLFVMSKLSVLAEFWQFLRTRKKYWLAPIIVVLLLLSALIVFASGSALAPFIYSLF